MHRGTILLAVTLAGAAFGSVDGLVARGRSLSENSNDDDGGQHTYDEREEASGGQHSYDEREDEETQLSPQPHGPPLTPAPRSPPPHPPLSPGFQMVEYVSLIAYLQGSVEAFDAATQLTFRSQLASTAGLTVDRVSLAVLGGSIRVEFLLAPTEDISFEAIAASLTVAAVTEAAAAAGVKVESVSAPASKSVAVAPPPPQLPPPEAPLGMLCSDRCATAANGVCEDPHARRHAARDGESSSDDESNSYDSYDSHDETPTGSCLLGTDCTDCGARSLCTTCQPQCRRRGLRLGKEEWCFESMLNDGICDGNCNVRECGYDGQDCSVMEIYDGCAPLHEANRALRSKPANASATPKLFGTNTSSVLVAVEPRLLRLKPFKVSLDSTKDEWSMEIEFTLRLRWRDSRYPTFPCEGVFPTLLHVSSTDTDHETRQSSEKKKKLLWFPKISLEDFPLHYDTMDTLKTPPRHAIATGTFTFVAGDNGTSSIWADGKVPADGATTCHDCLHYTIDVKTSFVINSLSFKDFPFDRQVALR
jgi:hypothetical protein